MFIRDLPPTARHVLILIGGLLALGVVYQLSGVIAPFLVSLVIAYILNPVAQVLERRHLPRPYAVLAIYVIGLLAGILFVIPLTLTLVSQAHDLWSRLAEIDTRQLLDTIRTSGKDVLEKISEDPRWKETWEASLSNQQLQDLATRGAMYAKDLFLNLSRSVFHFLLSAFSSIMSLALIPLLTFYILVDLDLLYQRFLLLVPPIYREPTARIARDVDRQLSSLLRGQLLAALIFALLMTIGLWLAGLSFSLVLGPLAGFCNLVPYLGGLVTIICSLVVGLSQYGFSGLFLWTMLKVGIALAIIQGIDGLVLQPTVIGETAGLHPLAVMLALVIAGSVFGFLGLVLAVPVTCILSVLSRELYAELYETS